MLEETQSLRGRKPKYAKREMLNAMLYVLRTGLIMAPPPAQLPSLEKCLHLMQKVAREGYVSIPVVGHWRSYFRSIRVSSEFKRPREALGYSR
jgi:hypothetical protein